MGGEVEMKKTSVKLFLMMGFGSAGSLTCLFLFQDPGAYLEGVEVNPQLILV